jgi:hypothetical protein
MCHTLFINGIKINTVKELKEKLNVELSEILIVKNCKSIKDEDDLSQVDIPNTLEFYNISFTKHENSFYAEKNY